MGGWVRLAVTDFGLGLQVPNLHLTVEVAKATETEESSHIAPEDLVPVMRTKLKHLFVMLVEHHRMCRHKPTDNNEILTLGIPAEVVKGAFEGSYFVDLLVLVIKNVQTVLTVIWLARGVIVSLELHQELVRFGTEPELDLLSLFDSLLIERVFRQMRKQRNQPWIGLLIQIQPNNHIIIMPTDLTNLKELDRSWGQLSLHLPLLIVHFNDFGVVSEAFSVIRGESDQGVTVS